MMPLSSEALDTRFWQIALLFLIYALALAFAPAVEDKARKRWPLFLSPVLLILAGFLFNYGVIDDSYISLRYAKNFAQGNGLVFNVGEHVEGYTSFLWVLLLAGAQRAGGFNLVYTAQIFSLGCAILTLWATARWLHLYSVSSKDRSLIILLFSVNLPFVFWAFSGMEASLFTLLLTVSGLLICVFFEDVEATGLVRSRRVFRAAAFCLALASLTRPEGYAFCLAFLGICAWQSNERLKNVLEAAVIFILCLVPHLLWRRHTYGFWLPNTFYAKVDFSSWANFKQGLDYLKHGAWINAPLVVLMLINLVRAAPLKRVSPVVAMFLVLHVLVILYTGGDHFIEMRFFVYLLPTLLIAAFANDWLKMKADWVFRCAVILSGLTCLGLAYHHRDMGHRSSLIYGKVFAEDFAQAGLWLKENAKPSDILATPVVGAMAYYSELRTIDMHGLTDAHIGHKKVAIGTGTKDHEKFDMAYVFSLQPDYVFIPVDRCPSWQVLDAMPMPPVILETLKTVPRDRYAPRTVERSGRNFCFLQKISIPK